MSTGLVGFVLRCLSPFVTFSSDNGLHHSIIVLSSFIAIHLSLIIRRYIGLPLSSFLSFIPSYLQSTLALSSGALLIPLSVAVPLSCTIHRLTKRWYCRPWVMSPSSPYPYSLKVVWQYIRMYL